jgi:hypothetical protein
MPDMAQCHIVVNGSYGFPGYVLVCDGCMLLPPMQKKLLQFIKLREPAAGLFVRRLCKFDLHEDYLG